MNDQLAQLESQLEDLGAAKRYVMYLLLLFLGVYFSWMLSGEDLALEIEAAQEKKASLEQKLSQNSIPSLKKAIERKEFQNLTLEDELLNLHFAEQFLQTKLQSQDFIFFDQEGYADILDRILRHSVVLNLRIDIIQSMQGEEDYSEQIREMRKVTIKGEGEFREILKLLQYIESLNTLLYLQNLKVEVNSENATAFSFELSNYGVAL